MPPRPYWHLLFTCASGDSLVCSTLENVRSGWPAILPVLCPLSRFPHALCGRLRRPTTCRARRHRPNSSPPSQFGYPCCLRSARVYSCCGPTSLPSLFFPFCRANLPRYAVSPRFFFLSSRSWLCWGMRKNWTCSWVLGIVDLFSALLYIACSHCAS